MKGPRLRSPPTRSSPPPVLSLWGQERGYIPSLSHLQAKHKERQWFLIQTRPNQELALAHSLHARSISYFLPAIPVVSRRSGTSRSTRTTIRPLFACYMFAFFDPQNTTPSVRPFLKATKRVISIIPTSQTDPTLHVQLQNLALSLANSPSPTAIRLQALQALTPGRAVRVLPNHKLAGLEGTVFSSPNPNGRPTQAVYIQIPLLAQAARVLIPYHCLKVI